MTLSTRLDHLEAKYGPPVAPPSPEDAAWRERWVRIAVELVGSMGEELGPPVAGEWVAHAEYQRRIDAYGQTAAWTHHGIPFAEGTAPERSHLTLAAQHIHNIMVHEDYTGPVTCPPVIAEVYAREAGAWPYDACGRCGVPLPCTVTYTRGGTPPVTVYSRHFFEVCPLCGGPVQSREPRH